MSPNAYKRTQVTDTYSPVFRLSTTGGDNRTSLKPYPRGKPVYNSLCCSLFLRFRSSDSVPTCCFGTATVIVNIKGIVRYVNGHEETIAL